jgi:hypothetical protein
MKINLKLPFNIKKIIFVLPAIFFIALLYFISQSIKEVEVPQSKKITSPALPQQFTGNPAVNVQIDKKIISLPTKLPLIELSKQILDPNFAYNIASNLGFEEEPIIAEDIRNGTVTIWNKDSSSLVHTEKLNEIDYLSSNELQITEIDISVNEKIRIAKDFLVENFGLKDNELSYVKNIPLHLSQAGGFVEGNKENSILSEIIFTYNTAGYEIVSSQTKSLVKVRLLNDGSVRETQVTYLGELSKTKEEYPLKSVDDIKTNVDQAEVVGISNIYQRLADFKKDDIDEINVDSIEVAYYLEDLSTSKYLNPIYILKGTAKSNKYPQDLYPTLYLSAIKE